MINLERENQCCGCGACANVCPKNAILMEPDAKGFLYPKVDLEKCVNCNLCNKVCPIKNADEKKQKYQKIYALRLNDEENLLKSSSGGAFFALASHVIKEYSGVVFGVEYSPDMVVQHSYSESVEGLNRFHGSKYVQSFTGTVYKKVKEFLDEGRFVMFTGTPCQNAALRLFLKKDYDNLLCVDNVCHSVPSPKIFKDYVGMIENHYGKKLVSINMRDKRKGWSHDYLFSHIFEDGSTIVHNRLRYEHWGKIFFSGLITRKSCNTCPFTSLDRVSDITVADFWDDSKKCPDAYSKNGTSLFMVNSKKGMSFFEKISQICFSKEISEAEAYQPCLYKPVCANNQFNVFWDFYQSNGFANAYEKFFKETFFFKLKIRVKRKVIRIGRFVKKQIRKLI